MAITKLAVLEEIKLRKWSHTIKFISTTKMSHREHTYKINKLKSELSSEYMHSETNEIDRLQQYLLNLTVSVT